MNLPELGHDPMDKYTYPTGSRLTQLTTIYQMPVRATPEKPGRALAVVWDSRLPLIDGFENQYAYTVTFDRKGKFAGNHYHHHKQELFIPVSGDFLIHLKNTRTGNHEVIALRSSDHEILYVAPHLTHTAVADTENAVLLVLATYPNNEEDEFPDKLVE